MSNTPGAYTTTGGGGLAADANYVDPGTPESRNNAAYGDLGTVGPTVTLVVGASGVAHVDIDCIVGTGSGFNGFVGFVMSGANTLAASDGNAGTVSGSNSQGVAARRIKLSGLTPGSTTFQLKYRTNGVSFSFQKRSISVVCP